jgi:SAM-dependent methyltransferase
MTPLDRALQRWRARMVCPWIPVQARVLDVGCHQGEFLHFLGDRIGPSAGMDPLAPALVCQRYRLLPERFGEPAPFPDATFDVVTALATLEHIRDKDPIVRECFRLLRPGGRVIITVPANVVTEIVEVLRRLRLADGMSLEEHHGFDPWDTLPLFTRLGFSLAYRKRFQLGLNHLFVFEKPTSSTPVLPPGVASARVIRHHAATPPFPPRIPVDGDTPIPDHVACGHRGLG